MHPTDTDRQDWEVFQQVNQDDKFGVGLGVALSEGALASIQRGESCGWFGYDDVVTLTKPPYLLKVYRLSESGKQRLAVLQVLFQS